LLNIEKGHGTGLPHQIYMSAAKAKPCRRRQNDTPPLSESSSGPAVPNMKMVAFEAAASAALLKKFAPQYTTMPSDAELKSPDALLLLEAIQELLQGIPRWHRKTWAKMLNRAFPELNGATLDVALQSLVVRCWALRLHVLQSWEPVTVTV